MAGAMRSVLSDMFREAIVEGHIVKNPVEATRIPEIKVARERLQLETYNATRAAAEHASTVPSRDGFSARYWST
ncbi:integrase [Salmonella enterica subsp. salamae serovar Greenside]|nr:integrase [Salmonella enterica subsp. salamae serovar Greenside]